MQDWKSRRPAIVGLVLCSAVGLYFLLGVIYALFHYSEFASANPQFTRYVIVPGLIGTLFIAIGMMGFRLSLPFGIYGMSALFALFLFESYLTWRQIPVWMGMLGKLSPAQQTLFVDDPSLVRGFTIRGLNRLAGVSQLREAMLSGFPFSRVILCTPGDDVISYKADRYGFNNPDTAYDTPLEVMLLGDSFVEGFCLAEGEDIASQMRRIGVATAALGVRGNGPLQELASLGRFGPLLQPKNVILAFFEGNDWENLEKGLTDSWLRSALDPNADFGSQSSAMATMEQARVAMEKINSKPVSIADLFTKRATLRNFFALQQTGSALGLTYSKLPKEIPEFRTILQRAKSIVAGWNGNFAVLYVPKADRFVGTFPVDYSLDHLRTLVLDAAAKEDIKVIDLTQALHRREDPARMYGADAHFSRDGASFVASLVARAVEGDQIKVSDSCGSVRQCACSDDNAAAAAGGSRTVC
ncbi:SGNH/GDSL hydrolase family protein [Allomesorhizobium camelthorni]|uniref:SGNH/GDSL hydrolase family protein n=1 Tax=Allomesorhizobium camelthorni TaxID=475069 RepID=UPI0031B576F1